jgi:hypothetical protein
MDYGGKSRRILVKPLDFFWGILGKEQTDFQRCHKDKTAVGEHCLTLNSSVHCEGKIVSRNHSFYSNSYRQLRKRSMKDQNTFNNRSVGIQDRMISC